MKVALVHDWITGMRGGERCLKAFVEMFPQADIYTLIHVPGTTRPEIDERVKGTSFFQKLPGVKKYYRALLPFFPRAIRSIDLRGYDLVISLSHAAAKNVIIKHPTVHICYIFTPMRYVWDQAWQYFGALTPALWPIIRSLREWDRRGSASVDHFVAISDFVAARVRSFYKRSCEVIYPPVDSSWIRPAPSDSKGTAFLYAGALVPYKRPDLVVKAFNKLKEPLWIAGSGPEEARLRKLAGPNVTFFGSLPDYELAGLYRSARALIFPGVEDFGMIPVECMAAGRPVIGINAGGLRETVNGLRSWNSSTLVPADATGVFFQKTSKTVSTQSSAPLSSLFGRLKSLMAGRKNGRVVGTHEEEPLIEAVRFFLRHEGQFSQEACIQQAKRFEPQKFFDDWNVLLERLDLREGRRAHA